MFDESGLERGEIAGLTEAFDGGDLIAIMHAGERQAAIDAPAIHHDRAGAALAVVAAFFRPGQAKMISERVEKRGARIGGKLSLFAIDAQRRVFHGEVLACR
jgi:hypothetical protein